MDTSEEKTEFTGDMRGFEKDIVRWISVVTTRNHWLSNL
jgi:hypothetical protein